MTLQQSYNNMVAERDAALADCRVFSEQVLMLGKNVDVLEQQVQQFYEEVSALNDNWDKTMQQRDQLRKVLEKVECWKAL